MVDMESVKAFFNRADKFAAHNNMVITDVSEGFARAEMELAECHMNGANTVHGGAVFTLADFAFAAASNSKGQVSLSINSSISIFRGQQSGRLIAEAREVHGAPKLGSYEVLVTSDQGELIASFQGMVYRKSMKLDDLIGSTE